MSTGDVKKYFSIFDPQEVNWINDSSCVISFENEAKTTLAYDKSTQNMVEKSADSKKQFNLEGIPDEIDDRNFDSGERHPETGMLILGQEFTHQKYYR